VNLCQVPQDLTTQSTTSLLRPHSSVGMDRRLKAATMQTLRPSARPFTFAQLMAMALSPLPASYAQMAPCSTSNTSSAIGGSMLTVPRLSSSTRETMMLLLTGNASAMVVSVVHLQASVEEASLVQCPVDMGLQSPPIIVQQDRWRRNPPIAINPTMIATLGK